MYANMANANIFNLMRMTMMMIVCGYILSIVVPVM